MSYIRYHEMENLVKNYKTLEAMKQSLIIQLQTFSIDTNEHIHGAFFGGGDPGMNVQSNKISDNTYNIANSYRSNIENDYKSTLKEIKDEFMIVELILDKLELALRRLPKLQREIILLYYCEELQWDALLEKMEENKMFVCKRQAQRYRKLALSKIRTISMIQLDAYEKVIQLIDGEG